MEKLKNIYDQHIVRWVGTIIGVIIIIGLGILASYINILQLQLGLVTIIGIMIVTIYNTIISTISERAKIKRENREKYFEVYEGFTDMAQWYNVSPVGAYSFIDELKTNNTDDEIAKIKIAKDKAFQKIIKLQTKFIFLFDIETAGYLEKLYDTGIKIDNRIRYNVQDNAKMYELAHFLSDEIGGARLNSNFCKKLKKYIQYQ